MAQKDKDNTQTNTQSGQIICQTNKFILALNTAINLDCNKAKPL